MSRKSQPSRASSSVSEALRITHASAELQVEKQEEITTSIYALSRECGWEIGAFNWNTYPMSFHWVDVIHGKRKFALLIHEFSPFVALSSTLPEYFNLLFFDDSAFTEAVQRIVAPFGVLSAAELSRPLSDADRIFAAQLGEKHSRDLKYWKPVSVGDVIFNWWD
jgi:hypothetical protein